ncbi:MAG: 30S ribosomal protein S16 [Phycisphaerales bacterium]
MVRLRMTRMGRRHAPFYRINAVEKRTQRDGVVLERLGWYNPSAAEGQQVSLEIEKIKHWLDNGAQATPTVLSLVSKHHPEVVDPEKLKAERNNRLAKKFKKIAEEKAKAEAEAKAAAEAEAAEKAAAEKAAAEKAAAEADKPAE